MDRAVKRWMIIGLLYSMLPSLFVLNALVEGSSGDPGPFFGYIIPPFTPLFTTYMTILGIASFAFTLVSSNFLSLEIITVFLNVACWTLIGAGIGKLITLSKRRKTKGKKVSPLLVLIAIVLLVIGHVVRHYFRGTLISSYIFTGSINISALIIIYFIVRKIVEKKQEYDLRYGKAK